MNDLKVSIRLFVILTILTGVIYPLIVTLVGQATMRDQANGSLIRRNGQIVGSRLIGQSFSETWYFWGRPSATSEHPYNASASSGSNLGPTNPELEKQITARVRLLKENHPKGDQAVPTDLATSSGSGLDPDISIEAARYQIERVAEARGVSAVNIRGLVEQKVLRRQWGILGEPRIRVLELNLELDRLYPIKR